MDGGGSDDAAWVAGDCRARDRRGFTDRRRGEVGAAPGPAGWRLHRRRDEDGAEAATTVRGPGGRTISPQQYIALTHADAVEGVLRRAGRPLGAWDILQEGRRVDALPVSLTIATIKRIALLLVRERRAQRGPTRDTWRAVPVNAAIV